MQTNYYTNLLDNSKTIKNTWSIINSIINPRKPNLLKMSININGKDCSESTISNKMNYHLTQIGNKLADKIDDISNKLFLDYLNNRNFNSMVLSTISASEIYLAINNFKPKVSRDEIDISMKLIQEISSSIIIPLMYIFNKSFDDGLFPSFFKRSKIIPIFKSGDCNDFNNYRPISLTLQFSKILEKLFSNRLFVINSMLLMMNNLVSEKI